TQIFPGREPSMSTWDSLPPLSTLNRITRVKPGATPLLEGTAADGTTRVVMAFHRYGRGKVIALPIQDTWLWQMHDAIPLEDMTHETFWRQILRWLVDGVPDAVGLQAEREHVEPGETVQLVAAVSDSAYLGLNDAVVTATATAPDGTTHEVAMDWTLERDGEYAGAFAPDGPG